MSVPSTKFIMQDEREEEDIVNYECAENKGFTTRKMVNLCAMAYY